MADGEARALLQRIVDAPGDDAARLVYADWLIENTDPRGELIQLQVKLAAEPDDARRRAIKVAENKLLKAHGATWLASLVEVLPRAAFVDEYRFEWARGFIERARISLPCLPMLGSLLERAPLVRALELRAGVDTGPKLTRPALGDVLASPLFARFSELELDLPGAGDALAETLARAKSLANVRTLAIRASVWGEKASFYAARPDDLVLTSTGAEALANSAALAGVKHLRLDSNRIGLDGVRAIARGAWRLETLDLGFNAIEAGLVEALRGPATLGLVTLRLAGNVLAKRDIVALAKATWLARLVDLDLESCTIGGDGTAAFCNAFALPALRRLRLERNSLGDAGGVAVAGCAAFAQLTDFEAGHNRMGAKAGLALATSPHLQNLERLLLNEPRWKPELAAAFAASPTLARTKIYLKGRLVAR